MSQTQGSQNAYAGMRPGDQLRGTSAKLHQDVIDAASAFQQEKLGQLGAGESKAVAARYFYLQAVMPDYVTGILVNDANPSGAAPVSIAKPDAFQQTRYNGLTFAVQGVGVLTFSFAGTGATAIMTSFRASDSTTENHTADPAWWLPDPTATPPFLGEIIRAKYVFTGINDANGNPIMWQDENLIGRNWGLVPPT